MEESGKTKSVGEEKKKSKTVKTSKPKKEAVAKNNKWEEEKKELNDKILRLSAELQNVRRRNEEEISRLCKYDGEGIILKILNVIDNFERAIKLDDNDLTDELSKFLSGFKMIYTSLINVLNDCEVKEIECLNKEFDPNMMEAVLTYKEESVDSGIVLEVLQKGYMYKDKVIRVAMVKVSE